MMTVEQQRVVPSLVQHSVSVVLMLDLGDRELVVVWLELVFHFHPSPPVLLHQVQFQLLLLHEQMVVHWPLVLVLGVQSHAVDPNWLKQVQTSVLLPSVEPEPEQVLRKHAARQCLDQANLLLELFLVQGLQIVLELKIELVLDIDLEKNLVVDLLEPEILVLVVVLELVDDLELEIVVLLVLVDVLLVGPAASGQRIKGADSKDFCKKRTSAA